MSFKKQHRERPSISARCAHHLPPPSKHVKKLAMVFPKNRSSSHPWQPGVCSWLQKELGQVWHSQHSPLFYSEGTTHHTEQWQDVACGIYSAKNPKAQGEDQQWQPRSPSSPPQKDVKPCSLTASCKLKLLTAVQGSVLFFHHWWQMVCAIIKSWFPAYNSNYTKISALGQQVTIFILGKSRSSLAVK